MPSILRKPGVRTHGLSKVNQRAFDANNGSAGKFHTDDPEAGARQSSTIAIDSPKSEPGKLVDGRVGVLDAGGGNPRLNGDGGLVEDGKQKEVPDSGEKVGPTVRGQWKQRPPTRIALIAEQSA